MNPNPKHIPTPEYRELEFVVEKRRAKLLENGHGLAVEQAESRVPTRADEVLPLADALKPAVSVFEGLQKRMEAFFAEMRPQVESAPQSEPCEFHPEHQRPIDFDLSCSLSRERGAFVAAYRTCEVCEGMENAAKQRRYWSRRGVPERVLEATFANFVLERPGDNPSDPFRKEKEVATARAWARRRGTFLLIYGTTGTGKGHLASACLKVQESGLWIEQVNMLADLRASYGTTTTKDLVEKWQDCEMLVLDEFGLSPGGRDEEPLLYQVLADRYDKRRPTIITSNLDRAALREAIGFRLLDRIREDCTEIVCAWDSWRAKK
ncbi:MAG: ATP-binding protein [Parafilimonas sp.]